MRKYEMRKCARHFVRIWVYLEVNFARSLSNIDKRLDIQTKILKDILLNLSKISQKVVLDEREGRPAALNLTEIARKSIINPFILPVAELCVLMAEHGAAVLRAQERGCM